MARRGAYYEAYGEIRGSCGHEHPTARGAQVCVQMDRDEQAELGGTSDREVYIVERGVRRPLFGSED